ncbi:hypothetical protein ACFL0V_00720 [Nanoarchaeota archaeon]
MGFLQKNVNIFLLLVVLLVAATLAASSAYYQNTFKKINAQYDDTSENLTTCMQDVAAFKLNLQKTAQSLNTTSQDIRRYDELYTAKASALSSTQQTLNTTSANLKTTQLDLAEMSALKNKFKNDFEDELATSRSLRESNAIVTAQKAQCESSLISYRSKVSSANSCINDFTDDFAATLTPTMTDAVDDCKQ